MFKYADFSTSWDSFMIHIVVSQGVMSLLCRQNIELVTDTC